MTSNTRHLSAKDYVQNLAARGRYHFSSQEARAALGVSSAAAKLALNRLARQGLVASPGRGFYVIVPPEYRSLGCPPADQFVPALMERHGLAYYAGLLSAAQYYGAAHQRPQETQIFLARNRRPIKCGAVRVVFVARKGIKVVPVRSFNTARGTIRVSTPEATAIDLTGYPHHVGGLNQVATILSELAESMDAASLPDVAATAPVTWAQRLGYLLKQAGAEEKASALALYVRAHAREYTPLLPGGPKKTSERDADWKLYVNTAVEVAL